MFRDVMTCDGGEETGIVHHKEREREGGGGMGACASHLHLEPFIIVAVVGKAMVRVAGEVTQANLREHSEAS
jgi:hypothetical protein